MGVSGGVAIATQNYNNWLFSYVEYDLHNTKMCINENYYIIIIMQ